MLLHYDAPPDLERRRQLTSFDGELVINQGETVDFLEAGKVMGEPLDLVLDEPANLGLSGEFTSVIRVDTHVTLIRPIPQRLEVGHDEGSHGAPFVAEKDDLRDIITLQ